MENSLTNNITQADIARENVYRLWVNGCAYIPIQDIAIYEKSFKKVNNL